MFLRKLVYLSIFVVLLAGVLGFGATRALPVFLGPKVDVSSPINGAIADGTSVSVRGTVYRAKTLYINGVPTAFTENGIFESLVVVYPGNNLLVVEAYDKYDRKASVTINVGTKN
jgi:hypothetical protein